MGDTNKRKNTEKNKRKKDREGMRAIPDKRRSGQWDVGHEVRTRVRVRVRVRVGTPFPNSQLTTQLKHTLKHTRG